MRNLTRRHLERQNLARRNVARRNLIYLYQLLFLIVNSLTALCASAEWYSHAFDVMGTRSKVEFEWHDKVQANELMQAVEAEMNRIDRLMSPYKKTSELTKINNEAFIKPIKISTEMFTLLQRSLYYSELTRGAFDISFSSVGYLYDYRNNQKPSAQELKGLKNAINYQKIDLDEKTSTVYFSDNRIKIDLGGIAKGHAVDQCIRLLQAAGVKNAYVNAGGDSRLIGRKHDRLWYIGIKHPRDKDKLLANLPLEAIALSTSGDYERFFIEGDIRYHHIIDPKTGDSARAVQSATILAENSTMADALSTSIFILGVERGMSLINSIPHVSAIMVDKHGKLFLSKDMAPATE